MFRFHTSCKRRFYYFSSKTERPFFVADAIMVKLVRVDDGSGTSPTLPFALVPSICPFIDLDDAPLISVLQQSITNINRHSLKLIVTWSMPIVCPSIHIMCCSRSL
eukprot:UN16174